MFKNVIDIIGNEAFEFIKEVAPTLTEVPLKGLYPNGYSWLLFHLLLFVFGHENFSIADLGKAILTGEDSKSKLKVIENGLCGIVRGINATKENGKEDSSD